MTASSISQYLEQRRASKPAGGDPRKDAWAALATRAVTADGAPAPLRNATFRSATSPARTPFGIDALNSPLDAPAPRAVTPLFRRKEAPPPVEQPDVEELIAEAYQRGVQEGLETARSEAASTKTTERTEAVKRAIVERLDFQMNEYAKLAETIQQGLKEVERRIADSVEKILKPFLLASVTSRSVDEIVSNLARLTSGDSPALLRICGPAPLLKLLKQRLAHLALEVEFVAGHQIEIKVLAHPTTIITELGPWADWLESLNGAADE